MGGSSSNSRNSNMVKVLDKSFEIPTIPIQLPKMNPYLNSNKNQIREDNKYPTNKSETNISRFDRLSNRVDQILSIFP